MTAIQLLSVHVGSPRVVGLTGGIGCGKSLVREMFQDLGAPGIDADQVARSIHQNPAHPAVRQIAEVFPGMVASNGGLKRGSLQERFATDQTANRQLKAILKPYVMDAIWRWTADQRAPYVIWESALMLDENITVDRVLVADAQEQRRIIRLKDRNQDWSEPQIRNILELQMSREAYLMRAQDVIRNDGSPVELKQQVEIMHRQYMTLWG
ncbi:MAG TPA: dephospho-CoA kinase [Burkholderiales bacterium]|nr:dephospho-CoA kinase [Burkholderiales bacterium]